MKLKAYLPCRELVLGLLVGIAIVSPFWAAMLHGQADTTAPTVTITAPTAAASLVPLTGTRTVMASASDAGGIRTCVVTVGGVTLPSKFTAVSGSTTPTQPATAVALTASWDTAGVADGPYTITVTVTDVAGNVGTATRDVTVKNVPDPVVVPPPPPQVVWQSVILGVKGAGSALVATGADGKAIALQSALLFSDLPTTVRLVAGTGPYCGTARENLTAAHPVTSTGILFPARPVPAGKSLCMAMTEATATVRGEAVFAVTP